MDRTSGSCSVRLTPLPAGRVDVGTRAVAGMGKATGTVRSKPASSYLRRANSPFHSLAPSPLPLPNPPTPNPRGTHADPEMRATVEKMM